MAYYLVRVGEGSRHVNEARKGGFVAIGWNEVPDLTYYKTVDAVKTALSEAGYNYTHAQLATQAGQLYRFGMEIQKDDIILSPYGGGEYLVGKVGEYYYQDNPKGACDYKHRRDVKWFDKTLLKDDMSTNLAYALGGLLTVYSLDKYSKELEALIAGEPYTPAEKPERIRDVILDSLMELNAKQFEKFIGHLLMTIGYTAETTQYVGDKGIDVNGTLDAEGLANITLRVQVKRIRSSIGNKEVLALRGALSQGEHGCLITLSNFTSHAIEEAQALGKITIKLIDGNDLAGIILKHFDEIDDEYKKLFGIRRRRDFNIEDLFEIPDKAAIELIVSQTMETIPDWDTLVCAAKEDGFKQAFLGQNAWWAVRLNSKTIPYIKYIAMYQVAPKSKITYYGEIDKIESYKDTGKYILYLKGDPIKLKKTVGLGKNPHLKPQGPKYAKLKDILHAKTLDDVFGSRNN